MPATSSSLMSSFYPRGRPEYDSGDSDASNSNDSDSDGDVEMGASEGSDAVQPVVLSSGSLVDSVIGLDDGRESTDKSDTSSSNDDDEEDEDDEPAPVAGPLVYFIPARALGPSCLSCDQYTGLSTPPLSPSSSCSDRRRPQSPRRPSPSSLRSSSASSDSTPASSVDDESDEAPPLSPLTLAPTPPAEPDDAPRSDELVCALCHVSTPSWDVYAAHDVCVHDPCPDYIACEHLHCATCRPRPADRQRCRVCRADVTFVQIDERMRMSWEA
ncbi:MAG: hypothetical protein M1832_001810 [Thelocarpon impressellum]|nr:MAG: hypothetical protein M1832_001810 [Thelocarpon impressellum]